jgi:hypothetical protein
MAGLFIYIHRFFVSQNKWMLLWVLIEITMGWRGTAINTSISRDKEDIESEIQRYSDRET